MIEYFYSAHSGFAYLGSARFMEIARAAGRQIAHRPIDLDKVLAVTGPGATGGQTPARRAYFFGREIERWAEERGAPVVTGTPSNHYGDMTLANGILIAGLLQGQNIDRLAHRFLEAHWRDSADLTDPATLSALGTQAGLDPAPSSPPHAGRRCKRAIKPTPKRPSPARFSAHPAISSTATCSTAKTAWSRSSAR